MCCADRRSAEKSREGILFLCTGHFCPDTSIVATISYMLEIVASSRDMAWRL